MNRKPTATEKAIALVLVALARAGAMTYVYWGSSTIWAEFLEGPPSSGLDGVIRVLALPGWIAGAISVVVSVVWCASVAWRWVEWALTTPVASDEHDTLGWP